MSPSHHRRQVVSVLSERESPTLRLATPIVALTAVLITAPKTTSAKRSRRRSNVGRKPKRSSSHAPTTASSVLPTAIPAAV